MGFCWASPFDNFPNDRDQTDIQDFENPPLVHLDRQNCHCLLGTESRIVNGKIAMPNSIPWQVSLAVPDRGHFCGGTIINSKLILTAAHCLDGMEEDSFKVRVGLHHLEDPNIDEKSYEVAKFYAHTYEKIETPGDIAVLELKSEIAFKKGEVEPACFDTWKKAYPLNLMASGWGTTRVSIFNSKTGVDEMEGISSVLKQVDLFEIECEKYLICVDGKRGDSTCFGDSGGPLHYTEKGHTTVEGVLSYVNGTNISDYEAKYCLGGSVFSRLSFHKRWFDKMTQGSYCSI